MPASYTGAEKRRTTRRVLLAAATAAVLALTACQPAQGPAGTVVGKDRTYRSATKQWTYKLTVRKPDSSRATFKVLRSDYNACYRGSAYPKCTEVR